MEISDEGARIEYLLEGDRCGYARQTRRGQTDIQMTFRPSENTACIIGDSALRGGFRIFCTSYKLILGAKGASAHIEYLSGEDNEKVSVKIRAIALGGA